MRLPNLEGGNMCCRYPVLFCQLYCTLKYIGEIPESLPNMLTILVSFIKSYITHISYSIISLAFNASHTIKYFSNSSGIFPSNTDFYLPVEVADVYPVNRHCAFVCSYLCKSTILLHVKILEFFGRVCG